MKHFTCIRLAVALLTLLGSEPRRVTAGEASSTFDTGYAGWSAVSLEPSGGSGWTWQPEGGNGGGFVQFRDNLSAPLFNFIASPVSFGGDWSALEGIGELRYNFRLIGDSSGIRRTYVLVRGQAGAVMGFDRVQTAGAGAGWETISMPLVKSEWQIFSGSWEGIVSAVTHVDIYPLYNGREYGRVFGIDNVMLGPRKYLRIFREGATSVRITWLTNFADHVLESATNMPAAGWSTVTNVPAVVGDHRVVTVGMDASKRFYRLRKP